MGDDVSGAAGVVLPPGVGEAVPLLVKIAASGEFGGRLSNSTKSIHARQLRKTKM